MPHFRSPLASRSGRGGRPGAHRRPEPGTDEHYAAVCAVLWSERELLESLACGLVVDQLVAGTRVGRHAAVEIQGDAIERLAAQEVLRAAIVESLVLATDADPRATLAELAGAAPEPWRTMLHEHREALRVLAADLSALLSFEQLSLREFLA